MPFAARSRAPRSACVVLWTVLLGTSAAASDYDIVIDEVHYHPLSGDSADEFLEIYNRGGTPVDLSGWAFAQGIRLLIPAGTLIEPKSHLVISPSAAHTRARYGIENVVGSYAGSLDNGGEVVTLLNAKGEVISRFHYGDGDPWPSRSDGLGPSLELVDPFSQIDVPHNWQASAYLDGTPGTLNSRSAAPVVRAEHVMVDDDEVWRFFRGTAPFPAAWRERGFNDASWESGQTGIGYGDGDDRTVLDDMEDTYISIAARKTFQLEADALEGIGRLELSVDYDDAFVAYLNGVEIARRNIGSPGAKTPYDAAATDTHEAGTPEASSIPVSLLAAGTNVLAVEVHNERLGSSDLTFIPRLVGLPTSAPAPSEADLFPVVINEVKPAEGGGPGFLELFNRGFQRIEVGGYSVVDSLGGRFELPGGTGTGIDPGEYLAFDAAVLGFPLALSGARYALLEADGRTWADAINPRPGRPGENGFSYGRFPDGDDDGFVLTEPTRAAPNRLTRVTDVVIHEIHFHPPFVPPFGGCTRDCSDRLQWIELHNRADEALDLTGWSLTKAVDFDFAAGTSIAAGGYLVVASSRADFLAAHPAVDPAVVAGDWTRDLAHGSDTINLRDELGNIADHVRYGDGRPWNDEEPVDGIDDGTFLSSEWPQAADGSGRTLEVIHPALENRLGGAWAAGVAGGTPGAPNSTFDADPPPVAGDVDHTPAVPASTDAVMVTCRVGAASGIQTVRALWHTDGGGPSGSALLRDDGVLPDRLAGDGVFSGTIAPQPHGTTVAFQVEVLAANGQSALIPRSPDVPPYAGFEGPFFLYQVLDDLPLSNPSPDYSIVMTQADAGELEDRDVQSDVLLYCTFIARPAGGPPAVRHLAGIRFRGSQTRNNRPRSYRIELPPDRDFEGADKLNFNATSIASEVLAADLFLRAGLPGPLVHTANLTFRGTLEPRYVRKEHIGDSFVERYFGGASDHGNLYRGLDPGGGPEADLSYLGPDPEPYRLVYDKRTNEEEGDYSDIIELTRLFDPVETPDAVFADQLEEAVDVWQWARFFALQAAIANEDGGIHSTSGEDYFLYHIPADAPLGNAGKWVLIPWDVEETYDESDERLFRPQIAAVQRFLTHERFAPFYYCNVMNVRSGVFSRLQARARFRLIDFLFGFGAIDALDSFVTARIGFFDENVPGRLTSGASGAAAGDLVRAGDTWRYFKGTQEPSGGTRAWSARLFDDSSWLEGPSGLGYGDGDDRTLLDDMEDGYTTLYIRRSFQVEEPAEIAALELAIDYDDGFIAFLNGTEIARRELGPPGGFVPFDATSVGVREAGVLESIDVSGSIGLLRTGTNVLAIQGVNAGIGSSDFSLLPLLRTSGDATSYGCGPILYSTADTIGLSGNANACETRRVEVNGADAVYDPFLGRWEAAVPLALGPNTVVVESFDDFGVAIERLEIEVRRTANPLASLGGTLAASTTWAAAGGPYLMEEDVVVPAGVTLRIEPGVTIYGQNRASIIVRGRLVAAGSENAPILFRAASCESRWGGIAFDGTGTGAADPTQILRFSDFEFGDTPAGFRGTVAPVRSKLLIESSSFRHLTANAVDGTECQLEVDECFFDAIHEGVHCTRSTVIITDSTFQGMVGDRDAIDFDLNGAGRNRIERCLFLNGSDDGIDLADTTVDIRDNVFIDIQDKALSLEGNGPLGPPAVTGNILYACGTAIALKNGVTIVEGHHNTLVANQEGVNLFSKDGAPDGGHADFHSMIVWNNSFDVLLDDLSTVSFAHSNISDGVWPGEGNIAADPRLADPANGNFSLLPGSPSIGTGQGGTDMGAVPFDGPRGFFVRGDVDEDGGLSLTDAIRGLDFLFRGGPGPDCRDRIDSNDDGMTDVTDGVFTLLFLFGGGREPPPPFPEAGTDPTPDSLLCP